MWDDIMSFAFITTVAPGSTKPKDVFLHFGDIGEMQTQLILTPQNARDLAKHLNAAAEAADAGKQYDS